MTASELRGSDHSKRWIVVLLVVTSIILVIAWTLARKTTANIPKTTINNQQISLETADTLVKRERGLSGRAGLAKNTGMVFIYNRAEEHCIWMREMQFNLDILWLDESKKVMKVERNVSPATYPQSFCANARYVIELSAGGADTITTGQTLPLML